MARGKLKLPLPVTRWFPAICHRNALRSIALDLVTAAASTELPDLHRDPFDRIPIATAIRHVLRLATLDGTIGKYPELKTLW